MSLSLVPNPGAARVALAEFSLRRVAHSLPLLLALTLLAAREVRAEEVLVAKATPSQHGGGAGVAKAPHQKQPIKKVSLGEVLRLKLDGLESDQPREALRDARTFASFRSRRMTRRDAKAYEQQCHHSEDPYCSFLPDPRTRKFGEKLRSFLSSLLRADPVKNEAAPSAQAAIDAALDEEEPTAVASKTVSGPQIGAAEETDPAKILRWISQGDLVALAQAKPKSFTRAIRTLPDWNALAPLATKAVQAPQCPSPNLLQAMGSRAEELFPDSKARLGALELYRRASECDATPEMDRARYRFSLLSIWAGDCVAAEAPLVRLADRQAGDYNARALFWLGRCAENRGNELLATVYRSRLIKEYPLSYHGLVLSRKRGLAASTGGVSGMDLTQSARVLNAEDPKVQFRSEFRPKLNPLIQRAEALLRIREFDLAAELLSGIEKTIDGAEPELKLYLMAMQSRAGEHLNAFRVLGGMFRENPSLLSRASLELFYPLVRYEEIRRHGMRVDPFLVLALIRQESGFNEDARSRVGALGLMQLMPATARRIERVSRRELQDAKTNIRLGVKYFAGLLERFGGDGELALAGYNAGPEKVDEWRRRYPVNDRMLFADLIPFKETREYVSLIGRNYFWYLSLYSSHARAPASGSALRYTRPAKPAVFTVFLSQPKK